MPFKLYTKLGNKRSVEIYFPVSLQINLGLGLLLIVLLALFVNIALSPIPIFSAGVDRFNFWEYARYPFLQTIVGNRSLFVSFLLGSIYASVRKTDGAKRSMCIVLFSLYLLYLVLLSEKFSGLVLAALGFYLTLAAVRPKSVGKKHILISLIAVCLLLFFAYFHYSIENPYRAIVGDNIAHAVLYRIFALQGHLGWGVIERCSLFSGCGASWQEMFEGLTTLMIVFTYNIDLFYSTLDRGVTMTGGYPAILLFGLPFFGALALHILFMFILGLCGTLIIALNRRDQVFLATMAFQAFFWMYVALSMGTLQFFARGLSLAFFVVIISILGMMIPRLNSRSAYRRADRNGNQDVKEHAAVLRGRNNW